MSERRSSGISDEAAIATHDLIHNAEVEEQRAHGDQAMTEPDYGEAPAGVGEQSTSTGEGQQKEQKKEKQGKHHDKSTMDKVKEALHIKK